MAKRNRELNDLMEFDHVIRVREDGVIEDQVDGVHAPEVHSETDGDGSILKDHEAEMIRSVKRQGWALLSGWTGQYSYNGVALHAGESIGGALEEHIRETPGLWVVCKIDVDEGEPDGWVVAHREEK
jgi:hypothetical protein